MTIDQLVTMAERIHNDEGVNLGASSTRDYRNSYWSRVIGCAYHGHPKYNPNPDKQWHIKKATSSSPQSDDVCVSMPSRQAWDCIPGAGSNGYRFEAGAIGVLPPEQIVYAPPVPAGSSPGPQPGPVYPPYPGDPAFDAVGVVLFADYAEAGQAPNPLMGRWFGRTIYDWLAKVVPTLDDSIKKHRREWRAALGLPPL